MQRDIRRDPGQWRGCHSFKDIICDGDDGSITRRDGGLKMGHTYYYYYELDGSTETHDPTLPTTDQCPYLPGQTVNTLWVPVEQNLRKRSASLNSISGGDLKTMNPHDKFTTPRPAPSPLANMVLRHVATAPSSIRHKRSARSLSPGSSWSFSPRKLFSRKASSSSLRASDEGSLYDVPLHPSSEDVRSVRTPSREGSRSRDISPDSLRRFLSDDSPVVAEPEATNERPSLAIPEDIAEENEDDDNFATSATSESLHFTVLSPPPSQHAHSRCTTPAPSATNAVGEAAAPDLPTTTLAPPTRAPPRIPDMTATEQASPPRNPDTAFFSADSSAVLLPTPASPESTASNDIPSFYYSDDDDDDYDYDNDEGFSPLVPPSLGDAAPTFPQRSLGATLSTYSLPLTSDAAGDKHVVVAQDEEEAGAAAAAAPVVGGGSGAADGGVGGGGGVPSPLLLTTPIPHSGLDDLVSELGWMAGFIHGKAA